MPAPSSVQRYGTALRARSFRRIWLAQLTSETGDWLGRVVLALVVYEQTGSAPLTGLVTAIAVAPYLGLGQLLTGWMGRRPPRSCLVTCDLVRAGVYLLMATRPHVAVLLGLEFINGLFTVPFESVRAALLPTTAPEDVYGDAVALSAITQEVTILVGYTLGGVLFETLGPGQVFRLNAATFVVSALLLIGLPRPRRRRAQQVVQSATGQVRAALLYLRENRLLRRWLAAYSLAAGCALTAEALAPVFVERSLGGGSRAVGVVSAVASVGVMIVAFVLPKDGDPQRLVRIGAIVGMSGASAAALLFAAGLDLPLAVLPYLAVGAVFASRLPGYQVAGRTVPAEIRASFFGLYVGAASLTSVVLPPLFGLMVEPIGVRGVMVLALSCAAASAAWGLVSGRAEEDVSRR